MDFVGRAARLLAIALVTLPLVTGCIEGAEFHGGAGDVGPRDALTDTGAVDARDSVGPADVRDAAPADAMDTLAPPDARPDVPRDVPPPPDAPLSDVPTDAALDVQDAASVDTVDVRSDVVRVDAAPDAADAGADAGTDTPADAAPPDVPGPPPAPLGALCSADDECASGQCLTPDEAALLAPGISTEAAVCAVAGCDLDTDCGDAAVCAPWAETGTDVRACFAACAAADGCADGLSCVALDGDTRFCHPDDWFWCDDGDACTIEGFDADTGACAHAARDCADGNACNGAEWCDPGEGCQDGEQLECDDGDVCTGEESCDPGAGCQAGEPLACDDGNACNGAETCDPTAGCQDGEAPQCDDGDVCTGEESCDPAEGCQDGEPLACDDGEWCNGAEGCDAVDGCKEGAPPDCDDGVDCTVDDCDEDADGCRNAPDDAVCDDGNGCTIDTCDPRADCGYEDAPDGTTCGEAMECRAGECVWDRTCGGVACPPLPDYEVECNAQAHCEYAYTGEDPAAWREWDVWIWVPPGSFPMGRPETEPGTGAALPQHAVTLRSGFFIGRNEVTVAQYEACETASPATCTAPSVADWNGDGWGLNRVSGGRSAHPQNGLTWAQAGAVCAGLGGRLPTEAEWEYAAKGPTHRKYVWGQTPDPTCAGGAAVFNEAGSVAGYGCGLGGTWSVGSMPAGAAWCGALDMAGNVQEWVQDSYHGSYVDAPSDGIAWTGPPGSAHVVRGARFNEDAGHQTATYRKDATPLSREAGNGARCVRDPSPVGVYCNVPCPALTGYSVSCNPQNHCAYTRSMPTEAWHEWDVWIWIPPGGFEMGTEGIYGPVHHVTFAEGFFVGKYEAVVESYEACESAFVCTEPTTIDSAWGTNRTANGRAIHPQNGLIWQQAADYCSWAAAGGRLLSEAEWEYAARGATGRSYPWGDEPDPTCANETAVFNEDGGAGGYGCRSGGTWPVGSMPEGASWCGALDMAGNVWELVEDWDQGDYVGAPSDGSAQECISDCHNRVRRGGGFDSDALSLRAASHSPVSPTYRGAPMGARCARDLPCAAGETATPDGCGIPGAACAGHADGVLCEDGDACTAGDACQADVCVPGDPPDCDDANACTTDGCDSGSGCTHAAVTCTDGDWCNGVETCDPAVGCLPGERDCDDGVDCTLDDCDEDANACTHRPVDAGCDDADPCTADTCHAQFGCQASPLPDGSGCGADHECVAGECVWTGSCGGVTCPPLPDYAVTCNAQAHCEYAYVGEDPAAWREWDVWIWVPPGMFAMGTPASEGGPDTERPVHTVSTDGFFLSKYELAVSIHEACEQAGACSPPQLGGSDSHPRLNRSGNGRADHPQNGLDWEQARQVCSWQAPGGRLPSEAEWEYAAAGPVHRKFPWGDAPAPTCVSEVAVFNETGDGCGTGLTWAVGSKPGGASFVGGLDMAGNVGEWVEDCWHSDYSGAPGTASAWLTNCTMAETRVVRGGSFVDVGGDIRTAGRWSSPQDAHLVQVGSRCVRDLSPMGVYCNVACPALAGYDTACNAQDHCEYARTEPTEPWHAYDVWIWVPPGPFRMGSPAGEGDGDEQPQHDVTFLEGYFVLKFEATADAWAAFLNARGSNVCTYAGGTGECGDADDFEDDQNVDWAGSLASVRSACQGAPGGPATASCGPHPVVEVTWYGAAVSCEWAGGRLCSEAEWERAAKGAIHRMFPWGDGAPDASTANCGESFCGDGYSKTAPVGSFFAGASPVGAMDMAGNVAELVEDDWLGPYDRDGDGMSDAPVDGTPWTAAPGASSRLVRGGGAWDGSAFGLRASDRVSFGPWDGEHYVGFRCCRSRPCDDRDPCTRDSRDRDGGCAHSPEPEGTTCGPGRVCDAGACVLCGVAEPTGPMGSARSIHTATLLDSGQVLVVGGRDGTSYLLTAELFDPLSGSWTGAGSMATPRGYHTATLLPSGEVLVAGGHDSPSTTATAELYDPGTDEWSPTAPMARPRYYHTATLLPSGLVLVAGGGGGPGRTATAELYDPAARSWTDTDPMGTVRAHHTATLLRSGDVLVAGGYDEPAIYYATAELYHPDSGTWEATGPMTNPRRFHAAVLLSSGKVLVTGGADRSPEVPLPTAEIYDPDSGTWSPADSMEWPRRYHVLALLPSGRVLTAGGYGAAAAELYDPSSDRWLPSDATGARLGSPSATLLRSGMVLVAGGHDGYGSSTASAFLFVDSCGD